ncbi:MAG: hypothetical protein ACYCTG_06605 [Ferrimicrobium sp.]
MKTISANIQILTPTAVSPREAFYRTSFNGDLCDVNGLSRIDLARHDADVPRFLSGAALRHALRTHATALALAGPPLDLGAVYALSMGYLLSVAGKESKSLSFRESFELERTLRARNPLMSAFGSFHITGAVSVGNGWVKDAMPLPGWSLQRSFVRTDLDPTILNTLSEDEVFAHASFLDVQSATSRKAGESSLSDGGGLRNIGGLVEAFNPGVTLDWRIAISGNGPQSDDMTALILAAMRRWANVSDPNGLVSSPGESMRIGAHRRLDWGRIAITGTLIDDESGASSTFSASDGVFDTQPNSLVSDLLSLFDAELASGYPRWDFTAGLRDEDQQIATVLASASAQKASRKAGASKGDD